MFSPETLPCAMDVGLTPGVPRGVGRVPPGACLQPPVPPDVPVLVLTGRLPLPSGF